MHRRVWVLGAGDPEMEAIEKLLRDRGERVAYATLRRRPGTRVHPAAAYGDDAVVEPRATRDAGEVVLVECAPELSVLGQVRVSVVDHHRPGDPGFGRVPAEYWRASSIGQVWRILHGSEPPPSELRYVAAADHCLRAAYAGECPGVDPDKLARWRAVSRAAFQRRTVDEIEADVSAAMQALREAPEIEIWLDDQGPPVVLADMRGEEVVRELPEAAARLGAGYTSGPLASPDGRLKFTCAGTPLQCHAWLQWTGETLEDLYGDPMRGFVGGYLPRK